MSAVGANVKQAVLNDAMKKVIYSIFFRLGPPVSNSFHFQKSTYFFNMFCSPE